MAKDIEIIIERLRVACPAVEVEQLEVRHPSADDDGLWFFSQPNCPFEAQLESPNGMCPFLIETEEHSKRVTANSVNETISVLTEYLRL
jgi:hypothetical protein